MNQPPVQADPFTQSCRALRADIKACGVNVRALREHQALVLTGTQIAAGADLDEVLANITLAYRHLEDAAMRLGKAIQAYDGGVSVYDK